ncbi:MAG: hypothetical protein AAF846_23405 [Chloroflexota bacterium]
MISLRYTVVDFVGRTASDFIAHVNEYYFQLPEERIGRRNYLKNTLENAISNWGTAAFLTLEDNIDVMFSIAPILPNDMKQQTMIWETLASFTNGYVFVMNPDVSSWQEAASIMATFQNYHPTQHLPTILLVHDRTQEEIEPLELKRILPVADDTPIFAYRSVLHSIVVEILLSLMYQGLDDMESRKR